MSKEQIQVIEEKIKGLIKKVRHHHQIRLEQIRKLHPEMEVVNNKIVFEGKTFVSVFTLYEDLIKEDEQQQASSRGNVKFSGRKY